jgi:tetratricopeptide (TPR) repeat protein
MTRRIPLLAFPLLTRCGHLEKVAARAYDVSGDGLAPSICIRTREEWDMKRLRMALATCVGAILVAGIAGCASLPPQPTPTATGAILSYAGTSRGEIDAQKALLIKDDKARKKIASLKTKAEKLREKFEAILRLQQLGGPDADSPRPTKEDVTAAHSTMLKAWGRVTEVINSRLADYELFMKAYPRNWYVRHRLAWFLADHNLRARAAGEWQAVIDTEPRFPYAYNNLGSLYNHIGRDMEAVDLFRKAIALHPDEPAFHINLAVSYSTSRDGIAKKFGWEMPRVFKECIASYARARKLAPGDQSIASDMASQYLLAEQFGVKGSADDALKAWEYYVNLDINDQQRAFGFRNIGRIYMRDKSNYAEAVRWLQKAVLLVDSPTNKRLLKQARDEWATIKEPIK